MHKNTTIIVGITGASGSGKSLLASTIVNELGSDKIDIITGDAYYKDQSHLPFDVRKQTNYDHPDAFDHELLYQHINLLSNNKSIDIPVYDYINHTRSKETRKINGNNAIIVLEGILLFIEEKIRSIIDIKIYVNTPLDICLIRRIERDVLMRERDIQSVIEQYQSTVKPMFHKFIEPSQKHADIIVPKGGKNRIAIDILKSKITELLQQSF
jgi:uridine kinase